MYKERTSLTKWDGRKPLHKIHARGPLQLRPALHGASSADGSQSWRIRQFWYLICCKFQWNPGIRTVQKEIKSCKSWTWPNFPTLDTRGVYGTATKPSKVEILVSSTDHEYYRSRIKSSRIFTFVNFISEIFEWLVCEDSKYSRSDTSAKGSQTDTRI